MFPVARLGKLQLPQRLRKLALLLSGVERAALARSGAAAADPTCVAGQTEASAAAEASAEAALDYGRSLASCLAASPETPSPLHEAARAFADSGGDPPARALRALDRLRHALLAATGQAPADWDLLDPETGREPGLRRPFPGMRAWLDDIRSPFNVGSMLRSAEAFGLEELLLSPGCADPAHPRAARSAMGADRLMPWRRADLEALGGLGPAFALELGGTPLDEFAFPERGLVILGSEELGVSPEALSRCSLGRVSIPMRGAKASINVGVAFGILLAAWAGCLAARGAPGAGRRAPGD